MPTTVRADNAAMDRMLQASFANIKIPIAKWKIVEELRDHVHEYPHTDGGQVELLGTKLAEIHISAWFHESNNPKYPTLYPDDLGLLVGLFESGHVDTLVLPNVGDVNAYCRKWSRDLDALIRSGETVEMEFRQFKNEDFTFALTIEPTSTLSIQAASLIEAAKKFLIAPRPDIPSLPLQIVGLAPQTVSLFDLIQAYANLITAPLDQTQLYSSLLTARIAALISLCDQASRVRELQSPNAFIVRDLLMQIWANAVTMQKDVASKGSPLQTFRTPRVMIIQEISLELYKDISHCIELLQLNPIDDASNIPAGFDVSYYPKAA